MILIPADEMSVLKSASEAYSIASTAAYDQELNAVTHYINQAINTGATSVTWNNDLMDEVKTVLEGQGYKITRMIPAANNRFPYKISWEQ